MTYDLASCTSCLVDVLSRQNWQSLFDIFSSAVFFSQIWSHAAINCGVCLQKFSCHTDARSWQYYLARKCTTWLKCTTSYAAASWREWYCGNSRYQFLHQIPEMEFSAAEIDTVNWQKWNIEMIQAENNENASRFVKGITNILLVPLSSEHGICGSNSGLEAYLPCARSRNGYSCWLHCFSIGHIVQLLLLLLVLFNCHVFPQITPGEAGSLEVSQRRAFGACWCEIQVTCLWPNQQCRSSVSWCNMPELQNVWLTHCCVEYTECWLVLFSAWNRGRDRKLCELSVACNQLKAMSQLQVTNTEERRL